MNLANAKKIEENIVKVYGVLNKKDLHDDSNIELQEEIEKFHGY